MVEPLVSVVMPVYGVERYVGDAIRSILAQSLPDFELIVVDDCSPDNSMSIVAGFDDPRIRVVSHAQNQGLSAARNTGITQARGHYVALLDSDDISPPNRLALQTQALRGVPKLIGCGGWMHYMNTEGKLFGRVHRSETLAARIAPTLLLRNTFFVSSMMFRREVFAALRYRTDFPMAEDYDFMVRASRLGALTNLPEVLLHYRIHATSLTSTKPQLMDECRRRIAREQLQRLGIDPSPSDLDVHMHAAIPTTQATRQRLNDVQSWLQRLAQLNQINPAYDPQAFADVLASTWFEVCTLASSLGPWTLARYLHSDLAGRADASLARALKFAAKSLLGLSRDALAR